jgi:diadenosine tetraphosphatase ApaH/serine/threonine PP2A family protein phosphatase
LRYAVFSDVHGNLEALRATLTAIEALQVDVLICLGDIVGYGPQPAECISEIDRHCSYIIAGNHDYAVADKLSISTFNALAREAVLWTRNRLGEADLEFLAGLPLEQTLDTFEVVHGSPRSPGQFEYVQNSYDACMAMSCMRRPLCFVGHSHVPVTFVQGEIVTYCLDTDVKIDPGAKVIVNVGSVGQPRDKDPRACFAIYDEEAMTVRLGRVPYNIDATANRILELGLPRQLGDRLRLGK